MNIKKTSESEEITTTRTEETVLHYEAVYASFVRMTREKAAARGEPIPEGDWVDPVMVVHTFLDHRANISKDTERQYRAAFAYYLKRPDLSWERRMFDARVAFSAYGYPLEDEMNHFPTNPSENKEFWVKKYNDMLMERQARIEAVKKAKGKNRTSAQKAKKLPQTDIEKMLDGLSSSKSMYKTDAAVWFKAALITGLRPSEWATAKFETRKSGKITLVVVNGKFSNERSFAETRTLLLDKLKPLQLEIVSEQLRNAQIMEARGQFEAWYESCRHVIQTLARSLWPDRVTFPSLYTARHLFAANAKNSLSRKETAALMGHGSEFTAGQHYARRSAAVGGMDVFPSDEDMHALTMRNGETSKLTNQLDWLGEKKSNLS